MYCTKCGTANSDEQRFCANCGAPMAKRGDTPQNRASSSSGQAQTPSYPSQPAYPAYSGGPAYSMQSKEGSASGRAVISMILSVISPFTCWFILSVPGLILGKMELNAIRDGQAPRAGETFAKIGYYVGLAVTVLSLVLPVIGFIFWAIGAIVF
jgi:Domain of unknown function (DUF4190)/zinc-ribbon domain